MLKSLALIVVSGLLITTLGLSQATAPAAGLDDAHKAKAQAMAKKGVDFLLSQKNEQGGWGFDPKETHPALTAMVLKTLIQSGMKVDDPAIAGGFEQLMKFKQPDGGFYNPKEGNANYTTSVAAMVFATANNPKYKEPLDGAVKFLRGQQITAGGKTPSGEAIAKDHPYEGGVSYGKQGRPDLSNQGFWMEAMHEAGVSGDDEAMQRAAAFVKRLQNRSEGMEGEFKFKGEDDGGFIYAVNKKDGVFVGESMAGDSDRGLRSYGSMTYTGFKSMLYANVSKKDPRVQAAFEWIRKNWRLDTNPNMPEASSKQGLFYYYQVLAKAMRAYGQDVITDSRGIAHNWRHELIDTLAPLQKEAGQWGPNEADRWMEGDAKLVTCYVLMALQDVLK